MFDKIKTLALDTERYAKAAEQAGLILMTAATLSGLIDLPSHMSLNRSLTPQPKLVFATARTFNTDDTNPLRREREESGPHEVSYRVSQRTPSRAGRA